MKIQKDEQKYCIDFNEYQTIYKESWFSMGRGKNEFNAQLAYLERRIYFAYKDVIRKIILEDGIDVAKEEVKKLVDMYLLDYKEASAFLSPNRMGY